MKYIIAIAALALPLAGCTTMGGGGSPVKSLGAGIYTVSEMDHFYGDNINYAVQHCAAMGQNMRMEGNSVQRGILTGDAYQVLVFRCEGVE